MADNPTRKFKFISPGVFVDEIDNSQLPETPSEVGPLVIGRSRKGPANKPVVVESFSQPRENLPSPSPTVFFCQSKALECHFWQNIRDSLTTPRPPVRTRLPEL